MRCESFKNGIKEDFPVEEIDYLNLSPEQELRKINELDRIIERTRERRESLLLPEIRREISELFPFSLTEEIYEKAKRYNYPIEVISINNPLNIEDPKELKEFITKAKQLKKEFDKKPETVLLIENSPLLKDRVLRLPISGGDMIVWIQYHMFLPTVKNLRKILKRGSAPRDKNGDPFVGHHWHREDGGPIFNMRWSVHEQCPIHNYEPRKPVNRDLWNKDRRTCRKRWAQEYLGTYWMTVIEDFKLKNQNG